MCGMSNIKFKESDWKPAMPRVSSVRIQRKVTELYYEDVN